MDFQKAAVLNLVQKNVGIITLARGILTGRRRLEELTMTKAELLNVAKPILFNTEMVKAILEGRKTVTRRVVKLPKWIVKQDDGSYTMFAEGTCYEKQCFEEIATYLNRPYRRGDVLYVRETWTLEEFYDDEALIRFRAGGSIGIDYECEGDTYSKLLKYADKKWNPSLFMPKEAGRIFLKVKNVHVERLQDMRSEDALNEGIKVSKFDLPHTGVLNQFKKLWNSTINKSDLELYGWDANPYVWVIEFERIKLDSEV